MIGDRVKSSLYPSVKFPGRWEGEWNLYRFWIIPRWSCYFGSDTEAGAQAMIFSYEKQYRDETLIPSWNGFWGNLFTEIRLIPERIRRRRTL